MNKAEIKARYLALAKYVAESMVKTQDRDEIQMRGTWDRGQLTIELNVPDNYRGLFIGRSGHMVRSLRGLLAAANLELPGSVAFDIA
jgi:predicted RNA-binding protein YlqC (UPF0109 family)